MSKHPAGRSAGDAPKKERLDALLVERGLAPTRSRARSIIMAGAVLVDDRPVDKPGTLVRVEADVRLKGDPNPFVSRGGLKLEGALSRFALDVTGRVAIDVGASTGGFTDCLLQRGVRKVYAVDVGYGQLAWKLRQDARVVVMERTNARHLRPEDLDEAPNLAVADVSFISLDKVLEPLRGLLAKQADVVLLIKPQFEVGKGKVGRGGVVRDEELRAEAIARVLRTAASLGFESADGIDSEVAGPKGNVEYLAWLRWGYPVAPAEDAPTG